MRLKFLGTSAGWPLPRLGCNCAICTSTDPRDKRRRSAALINDFFLIDSGFDIYHEIKAFADPTKIKYVYITHDHPDHYAGLWDLSHIYSAKGKIQLIIHPNTYKTVSKWVMPGDFEVKLLPEGEVLTAGNLQVQNAHVHHTKESSFGLILQENQTKMFYMPDFKTLPETTKEKIRGFDLLVMDAAEWEIHSFNHQTVLEGIELAKELGVSQAYFTHIGHRTKPHQEFSTYLKKHAPNIHVPYDGLEIRVRPLQAV